MYLYVSFFVLSLLFTPTNQLCHIINKTIKIVDLAAARSRRGRIGVDVMKKKNNR